jgi:succinate-semialdehyde dehydrogenase / glutarate-semialdehyde dehydrogenase
VTATLPAGRLLIGGASVPTGNDRSFPVIDPTTGQVLTTVADADESEGIRALDAAVAAAEDWARTPARDRAELLRRAFDLLIDRRDDYARLITAEMGKPWAEAQAEVSYGAEFLRWFSEETCRVAGRVQPDAQGRGTVLVTRRPVGPCLLITPWNFPLAMATRKIGPALAAGCTVVVKPAEATPLTTLAFADLLTEVGVPAGVVNVITTSRPQPVVAALLADPRLRKISFTGSTQVGRSLIAQAGQNVLRTSMELGGNAPFLVFDDADLDAAVDGAMTAKFRNTGQACTAANRFLVHREVVEEFTDRVTRQVQAIRLGPASDPISTLGPLIDDRAVRSVDTLVQDAVSRGARITTGGSPAGGPGSFYLPTVLADVDPSSALCHQEVFGPVLAITPFDTDAEAVRSANDTEYGLAAYVFTRDLARIQRLMGALQTGILGVNTGLVSNAAAPFGGLKQSGSGKEGGVEGIEEYLASTYTLIAP